MRTIIIQLDGSSAHNIENDGDVNRSIFDSDLPIQYKNNPPQNTYLNVLYLGYY